jgi:hypothetical protein
LLRHAVFIENATSSRLHLLGGVAGLRSRAGGSTTVELPVSDIELLEDEGCDRVIFGRFGKINQEAGKMVTKTPFVCVSVPASPADLRLQRGEQPAVALTVFFRVARAEGPSDGGEGESKDWLQEQRVPNELEERIRADNRRVRDAEALVTRAAAAATSASGGGGGVDESGGVGGSSSGDADGGSASGSPSAKRPRHSHHK